MYILSIRSRAQLATNRGFHPDVWPYVMKSATVSNNSSPHILVGKVSNSSESMSPRMYGNNAGFANLKELATAYG